MNDEYVSDDLLSEAIEIVISGMEIQMQMVTEMAVTLPDGSNRMKKLLDCRFYYGYVTGLSSKTAFAKFGSSIEKENLGKNTGRLLQAVIANIFFPDTGPDWAVVQAWEAQSAAYGMNEDSEYEEGYRAGVKFADELLTGTEPSPTSLLAAELLRQ